MLNVIKKPDKKEVTTILGKDVHKIIEKYSDKKKYRDYREKWKLASTLEYTPDFPLQIDFELNYLVIFLVKCAHGQPKILQVEEKKLGLVLRHLKK